MSTTMTTTVKMTRDDTQTTTGTPVDLTVGDYRDAKTIAVGTSEVTILLDTSITDAGLFYCKNHAASTVYVDIGYATTDYKNRLYGGEQALIPLLPTTTTVYVVASAAGTKFQYECSERV